MKAEAEAAQALSVVLRRRQTDRLVKVGYRASGEASSSHSDSSHQESQDVEEALALALTC